MTDSNLEAVKEENIVECRACLQEIISDSTYYNLFDTVGQQEQMRSTIAEKLSNIAQIEISEADELPKVICDMCCTLLQSAHSFAVTVRKTDELLRQKFANVQKESENVWPKPIQINNNIDSHYIPHTEIKEEVLSEDESFAKQGSDEHDISKVEIKVESNPQDCDINTPIINGVCSLNDMQIEYIESENDGSVEPKEFNMNRSRRIDGIIGRTLLISGVESNDSASGDDILEEMTMVQTPTVSEEHASVNESEVCYPNYVTEQFLNEKESFYPKVVTGSATSVKSSDILQNQGEDQRSLADNDNILTETGVHNEDLTHNEQLSRNTNINSYGKYIKEKFNEPITITANTCDFSLPKTPARNLDINSDDLTTNDNLTTPDSIVNQRLLEQQASAGPTNSNIAEYPKAAGSQTFKRGRKRKCNTNKKYIDYVSDEDFSIFMDCDGSDSDESVVFTDTEDEEVIDKNKRTSKKKKNKVARKRLNENFADIPEKPRGDGLKTKRTNTKKERSQKIKTGQEYVRTDGKIIQAKAVQPNPCIGKKCGNNCENISEERRISIFNHFWNINAERRRDWLLLNTQKEHVKRKRSYTEMRSVSFKYQINEGEGKRPVCLQFLAATLNVSSKSIYKIVKNWDCAKPKEDLRGKHVPPNKTQPATVDSVRNFIKSLPAVPSQYGRRDPTKVYLTQDYKNIASIYKVYKKQCLQNGVKFVSEKIFRKIFSDEFNIGFHIPKKEKCLKCLKFQESDAADGAIAKEKQDHDEENNQSYNRFSAHKNIHKYYPSTLCVSFDIDKVLNTPHGESILLYYSRKLAVYNVCFYENGTRKVFCYYWDESNGNSGANEIASVLHRYIQSVDRRGNINNLLLYCDRCPGQNKNKVVMAMLHSILQQCENLKTIQMNYLLTGHTYNMPVDGVHAAIENNMKNTIIYAPSQWYTVFSTARNDPSPYEVEQLTYEDFYKWDSVADEYFNGSQLEKISKIRIATLKKNNFIKIKYSMNKSAKSHTIEVQCKTKGPLMSCYSSRIPIATKKYNDLLKLCNDKVVPTHFRNELTDIPHSTCYLHLLPVSDVDDVDSDYEKSNN